MKHQDFRINKETGEIVGVYELVEYQAPNTADSQFYKYTSVVPEEATNVDQVLDYISSYVDKRKLVTYNGTKALHDMACGNGVRNKTKSMFTLPQYKVMNNLIKALVYRNIVIGTKTDIAKKLGIDKKHLTQTLKTVSGLVRVTTDGMSKGQIKILIHPSYGFKYESGYINVARRKAEQEWIKQKKDYNEQIEFLCSPNDVFESDVVFSKEFEDWLSVFSKAIQTKASKYKNQFEQVAAMQDLHNQEDA